MLDLPRFRLVQRGCVQARFEYQYNSNLILRAGYNHTDNPIQSRDVTFNMIAPGVVRIT
jgi:hypothetical protein